MKRAILQLQRALRRHYGNKSDTGTGNVTLSVAHDRVELTNEAHSIVARGPVMVATVLRRKRTRLRQGYGAAGGKK